MPWPRHLSEAPLAARSRPTSPTPLQLRPSPPPSPRFSRAVPPRPQSRASSSSLLLFIPQDRGFQQDNQLQSKGNVAQLPGVQGTRSLQPASLGTRNTTSLCPIYKGSSSSTLKLFFKKE